MWKWFNCYLSGRHDYGMWCEPGAIYLRCLHCGRRSTGWSLKAANTADGAIPKAVADAAEKAAHVLPFGRVALR